MKVIEVITTLNDNGYTYHGDEYKWRTDKVFAGKEPKGMVITKVDAHGMDREIAYFNFQYFICLRESDE